MNLLFSIDRAVLPHLKTCLGSILRFPSKDGYRVFILHTDLMPDDLAEIEEEIGERAILCPVKVDLALFSGYPTTGRYPKQIYYRLLAPKLLPDDVERVLYLDVDITVIKPLDEFYATPFDGAYFVACTHVGQLLNQLNRKRLRKKEEGEYINTGVLLMDLPLLRENDRTSEMKAFVERYGDRLLLPDQDILFALYGSNIKLADWRRYNLSEWMFLREPDIDMDWVEKNSVIIHYCGRVKPWKSSYHGPLARFYFESLPKSRRPPA